MLKGMRCRNVYSRAVAGLVDSLCEMPGHMLSMNSSLATVTVNSMYLASCLRLQVGWDVVVVEELLAIARRDMRDSADSKASNSRSIVSVNVNGIKVLLRRYSTPRSFWSVASDFRAVEYRL